MTKTEIGPRMAGDRLMYNRAVRVDEPRSWLFVSGHEARDDDGAIACEGDMAGQMRLTLRRLGQTVAEGGMTMADVVRIRVVTTDLAGCTARYDVLMDELAAVGCRPASSRRSPPCPIRPCSSRSRPSRCAEAAGYRGWGVSRRGRVWGNRARCGGVFP